MIFVTGSTTWTNVDLIEKRLIGLPKKSTIIHGGFGGADAIADKIARSLNFDVKEFATDGESAKSRNAEMAKLCLSAFAFCDGPRTSDDTLEAIRSVLLAGKLIDIFLPDGTIVPASVGRTW